MPGLRPAPGNLKPASQSYDGTPRGGPEKTSRQFLPRVLSGGVINMTGSIYFDVHSNTRGTWKYRRQARTKAELTSVRAACTLEVNVSLIEVLFRGLVSILYHVLGYLFVIVQHFLHN